MKTTPITLSFITILAFGLTNHATAKSPESIKLGKQLFERDWSPTNPKLGSDGLGPLFNATSCVACHNQGGPGGGGEARFNALSIGIERLTISGGKVSNDVVARMLRAFHPGFIQPGGTMLNTLPLVHHGGSVRFGKTRSAIRAQVPVAFSGEGGPENAIESRHVTATPITFTHADGRYTMELRARLFQRNTTALFGAGLIDQVRERDMRAQFQAQKRHPEISGRPSTLTDGRVGKFGWRANIAALLDFNDQACANEVGLETRRKPQPSDPTNPNYRNPAHDIADHQIRAINAFVGALPAPGRDLPGESLARIEVERGEKLFATVGCAVCHVPDMGPAKGIYSDLLLHDMGYELVDLNHAEPYIRSITPVTRYSRSTVTEKMVSSYYGGSQQITTSDSDSNRPGRMRSTNATGFTFVAAQSPRQTLRVINVSSEDVGTDVTEETDSIEDETGAVVRERTTRRETTTRAHHTIQIRIEPTNFNQEWRTPPLWGLRDSAPYMHDGRAQTVLEAISMHDGESAGTRDRFLNLPLADRHAILAFLDTMVAPRGLESGSL